MSSSTHRGQRKRSGSFANMRYSIEVAAAYDALAADYNREIHPDQWMRKVLWRRYNRLFRAGDRVLDVACGTGLDMLYLARRGARMTGIDVSARMIAELESEAERQGLRERMQLHVADVAELTNWPGNYFHGILSAFAGLNTVHDLRGFAADAARLLLPRGRMVVHMLTPGCLWERRQRSRQEGSTAAEEYFRRRMRTVVVANHPIRHRIVFPGEAYRRYFEPHFHLRRCYGLGFLLPRRTMGRLPAAVARLVGGSEAVLGSLDPFRSRSRYLVLELESRRVLETQKGK